jgi:hypothetical protein
MIHIVPDNDVIDHIDESGCDCGVTLDMTGQYLGGEIVAYHYALDGRPQAERFLSIVCDNQMNCDLCDLEDCLCPCHQTDS